jgi:hypothetical protein
MHFSNIPATAAAGLFRMAEYYTKIRAELRRREFTHFSLTAHLPRKVFGSLLQPSLNHSQKDS